MTVTLIEDNLGDIELVKMVFNQINTNYSLQVFTNGVEFLNELRSGNFNSQLILLDLNLPGINGIELIQHIRAEKLPFRLTPICVLSTSRAQNDIQEAYFSGVNCFLTKPLNFVEFKVMIETSLRYWFEIIENPLIPSQ